MRPMVILVLITCLMSLGGEVAFGSTQGFTASVEKNIGRNTAQEVIKRYGGQYYLPIWEKQKLDAVFARLVAVVERRDIDYTLTVLDSKHANALAVPGGYVFITRGLLELIGEDTPLLASVLGHELAHIEKKHGLNALLRQLGLSLALEVGLVWMDLMTSEGVRMASLAFLDMLHAGWGREAEFEADLLGQQYAAAAGFDPVGGVHLLDLLANLAEDESVHLYSSHPATDERQQRLSDRLESFWPKPQAIAKRPADSREQSKDPLDRFEIIDLPTGLTIKDHQTGEVSPWLQGKKVTAASWAPNGQHLVVSVLVDGRGELWLLNRMARVVKVWLAHSEDSYAAPSWSPQGDMVAFVSHSKRSAAVWVGYPLGSAKVKISGELHVKMVSWQEEGILLTMDNGEHYQVRPIAQVPVSIKDPIPLVFQREPHIQPVLTKDGNTFTIRRPYLWQQD